MNHSEDEILLIIFREPEGRFYGLENWGVIGSEEFMGVREAG